MEQVLKGLKPEKVFHYFEEISKIPRGSGNEKEISDYLYRLCRSKGWEVVQDEGLNIIIRKPATHGYENSPAVMLQGHMDMVCEKNENVVHDFEKDPIKLRIKDGYIYATETTLGADNGIAVSMILALLDSDEIKHPQLEVLITTDEEKGMTGAKKVDGRLFKSKYLINLDSEEEGVFTTGCAGGCDTVFKIPLKYNKTEPKKVYKLSVKGLLGGHSGVDIGMEKGNANKILGRILYDIMNDIELVSITGGSKRNAIPRSAHALISIDNIELIKSKAENWNSILKNEYSFSDPSVSVVLEETGIEAVSVEKQLFKKIVAAINMIPNSVQSRSTAIDLVISSNNLGVITTEDDVVTISNSSRSSVKTLLTHNIIPQMEQIAESLGFECTVGEGYPGWEYVKDSIIRDICVRKYKELFGKEPEVGAIHAGLECGLLMEKIKGLDAVSMGPDMYDVHTSNEHIDINSIGNTYHLLCEILEEII